MAKYTERTNAALGVALRRQYLSPLDVSAVFRCKADFEAYVQRNAAYSNADYTSDENTFLQKINPYSYDGQVVSVLDEAGGNATVYVIKKAGALAEGESVTTRYKEVGSVPVGDGKTVSVTNGVIMLAGLSSIPAERTKAYQPTLDATGNLVWSPVSETTVEGLQTLISALQTEVATIKTDVDAIKANYLKSVEYEEKTGVFTFTKQDGTKATYDLAIEKVVTNFKYNEETKALDLTLADGTVQSVSMSAFIDVYTAEPDAVQVQVVVSAGNVISATIVDGAVTEAKLAAAVKAKLDAGQAASNALASKADKTALEELETTVEELETTVGGKVTEEEVNALIQGATIQGGKVSGAVAQATKAASADKVVSKLSFGDKSYDGSAAEEITADDLGVSEIGKSGKLSDATQDATHRVVTDAEKTTWNAKQDALSYDTAPTANSTKHVKSGDIYTADKAIEDKVDKIIDGTTKVPNATKADGATSADKATKLAAAKEISLSGDVSGKASFDGSANAAITAALSNTGVAAGTYSAVTVDAKGRVSAGAQVIEIGAAGQTEPSETLAVGGLFFKRI